MSTEDLCSNSTYWYNQGYIEGEANGVKVKYEQEAIKAYDCGFKDGNEEGFKRGYEQARMDLLREKKIVCSVCSKCGNETSYVTVIE